MNQDCCEHLEDIEILVNDCFGTDKIGFKQIQRICNEQIVAILSWSFGDISENPEIQFPNIITCV